MINNVIMLGVVPTIDQDVIQKGSLQNGRAAQNAAPRSLAPKAFTAVYKNNSAKYEVEPSSSFANTPQKNSSLISRSMEYIFGW